MACVLSGTLSANLHFFDSDLKFYIDCDEVVSGEAFESVLAIMRFLAAALGLSVLAVVEGNSPQDAFLRMSPDGQAVFLPSGSVRPAEPSPSADPARDAGSRGPAQRTPAGE
jgi:hypothetical protein